MNASSVLDERAAAERLGVRVYLFGSPIRLLFAALRAQDIIESEAAA